MTTWMATAMSFSEFHRHQFQGCGTKLERNKEDYKLVEKCIATGRNIKSCYTDQATVIM